MQISRVCQGVQGCLWFAGMFAGMWESPLPGSAWGWEKHRGQAQARGFVLIKVHFSRIPKLHLPDSRENKGERRGAIPQFRTSVEPSGRGRRRGRERRRGGCRHATTARGSSWTSSAHRSAQIRSDECDLARPLEVRDEDPERLLFWWSTKNLSFSLYRFSLARHIFFSQEIKLFFTHRATVLFISPVKIPHTIIVPCQ